MRSIWECCQLKYSSTQVQDTLIIKDTIIQRITSLQTIPCYINYPRLIKLKLVWNLKTNFQLLINVRGNFIMKPIHPRHTHNNKSYRGFFPGLLLSAIDCDISDLFLWFKNQTHYYAAFPLKHIILMMLAFHFCFCQRFCSSLYQLNTGIHCVPFWSF